MNLEELQSHFDKLMHQQNNQGIADFEGYSPYEMTQILYSTFEPESPIKLQKLSSPDYQKIPILNQVKYLANIIDKTGEIKLTKRGYLPRKIVSDIYQQGFLKDRHIENGFVKLYKETDSISINLTRILVELSGLTKKRNGKLSLTKSSVKILADDYELLKLILSIFTVKFNWAYFDGYGENQIGQLGWGFSLILLSKYGNEKQLDSFYAERYFRAYPKLLESIELPTYTTVDNYVVDCYSIRTFDRFLDYFGLIKIDKESNGFNTKTYITKTDLFDRLIKCTPHKTKH